jgi:hypothetical protein
LSRRVSPRETGASGGGRRYELSAVAAQSLKHKYRIKYEPDQGVVGINENQQKPPPIYTIKKPPIHPIRKNTNDDHQLYPCATSSRPCLLVGCTTSSNPVLNPVRDLQFVSKPSIHHITANLLDHINRHAPRLVLEINLRPLLQHILPLLSIVRLDSGIPPRKHTHVLDKSFLLFFRPRRARFPVALGGKDMEVLLRSYRERRSR